MKHDILSPEERDEWSSALSESLNGSRKVDDAAVARAESALNDAEQAHRPWARYIQRSYILRGLRADLNALAKSESVALVAYNGTHVSKSVRLGVRRRREDGSSEAQQVLIHEMSWAELEQWLLMISTQVASLLVNRDMAQKLLALRDRFPDSVGPRDACAAMGTTIEDFLAAA